MMGHKSERGVLPKFRKPNKKSTVVEDETDKNEQQQLIQYYESVFEVTRNRLVPYEIADSVGKYFALYGLQNDWKMFASLLGINRDEILRKINYWADKEGEYPLTKLLCEDFKENEGKLESLLQSLLKNHHYQILKDIRPFVEECISKPEENSNETVLDTAVRKSITYKGDIQINIADGCRVSINTPNNASVDCMKDICHLMEQNNLNKKDSKTSTTTDGSLCKANDGNIKREEEKSINCNTCIQNKETQKSTVYTSAENFIFGSPNLKAASLTCDSSIFSMDFNTPSFTPSSVLCSSSDVSNVDLKDVFCSLSSSNASNDSFSIPKNCVSTAKPLHGPIQIFSGEPPVFVFITHTVDDTEIAETVACRLRMDFKFFAVTQFELQHLFCINHENTVSKILNDIDFVMPIVSAQYMQEIEVPVNKEECSTQQLAVRNIFTALQSEFFRKASLNWKIRPVVVEGESADMARRKQELRCAMRLWSDWRYLGRMLRNTVLLFRHI